MKVTVCVFPDQEDLLEETWQRLIAHVRQEDSDLVLLGEMPFYPWPANRAEYNEALWQASMEAHARMEARFGELGDVVLASSRPQVREGRNFHEAFVWDPTHGLRAVHDKYYLPEEDGFWEATWYSRGEKLFEPIDTPVGKVGFLMCTEMWFTEHARAYGRMGVDLLLCPRATGMSSRDKWIAGGRAAAVCSGAFCLSANRGGVDAQGFTWADAGWIIDPEEAEVLGIADTDSPFCTREIDLSVASTAKSTYPRYVLE